MGRNLQNILAQESIFGPGSKELELFERNLIRYFGREFQRYKESPVTLESQGISTDTGPMMEDTINLMEKHYDAPFKLFKSFLDEKYLAYSMAYYGDTPTDILGSCSTLEEAQSNKFRLITERAQINGDENLLNIGCGFGSLETYLLNKFQDIQITGITPSKTQANYIKTRLRDAGDPIASGRFTLIEGAFDQMSAEYIGIGQFDKVLSIAVFEQVRNMKDIQLLISRLLKPNGLAFHHFITSQYLVPQLIEPDKTIIGEYFPGGRVWPHNEFSKHTKDLKLEGHWFINGLNYWRTISEWHKRYWNKLDTLYNSTFDLTAIAHWNRYFSLCKTLFAPLEGHFYGNSHYLFRKE